MKKQTTVNLSPRQRNSHLLYASGMFTDEEVLRIDRVFEQGNFPFDLATYHLSILSASYRELQAAKLKRLLNEGKPQGHLQLGSYKFRSKPKKKGNK